MSVFVISCGGTGGHLSPGIALAEELIRRGHECYLLISNKEVDSQLIKGYPHLNFQKISGIGFSLKPLRALLFSYHLSTGIVKTIHLLRKVKPDVVIGFGGYTTLSVGVASFLLGCPLILHEANRITGKAIRMMSVISKRVYLPPGAQLKSLPPKAIRHFGFPLRKEIRPITRQLACQRLGLNPDKPRLLVIGGSQGASTLNQWVLDNFESLAEAGIDIFCITGLGKGSEGKLEYKCSDGTMAQAVFSPFSNNIVNVLNCADLAVSRAGAGTIAEFSRCHLPSILIPYKYAADNHQLANAQFLERQGGCIVLEEEDMDHLLAEVKQLIYHEWILEKIRKNLQCLEVQNSLKQICDDLESISSLNIPLNKLRSGVHSL